MKQFHLAVALVAITAISAAACSSGSSPSSKSSASSGLGSPVSTYGTATGTMQHLTWDLPYGEPNTIDPADSAYFSSQFVAMNLCDTLLRINPNYSISPNLATYTQPNLRELIFKLRPNVHFWDGRIMTAKDVVWSLDHAAQPSSAWSFVFQYVQSIKATSTMQVTIKFSQPDELFVKEMASVAGAAQEQRFSETAGSKLGSPSVGVMCSGPFKFDRWSPGTSITLGRNDSYWNVQGRAHAMSASLEFITNTTALAQALISGQIDGAYEVPAAAVPSLEKAKSGKLIAGLPTQLNLALVQARPTGPLANKDLREAFQMTINRQQLVAVYNGAASVNYTDANIDSWRNGATSAAAQLIWQQAYNRIAAVRSKWGSSAAITAAKSLAHQAGYTGEPIALAVLAGDAVQAEIAQIIQANAARAGITVEIKSLTGIQYSNAQSYAKDRANLDVILSPGYNVAPDPMEAMGFLWLPGSFYNWQGYRNQSVAKDYQAALAAPTQVARARDLVQAQTTYEQAYETTCLLQLDELTYLHRGLGGATTSFAYLSEPALASIGPMARKSSS
jgi:peptide/nickel transport system substrate-binding protein